MGDRAWDRLTSRLIEMPGPTAGLVAGLARGAYDDTGALRGRYMCRACRQDLILRAIDAGSKQQPHFRHKNNDDHDDGCRADPERRRRIDHDDQAVLELRDALIRVLPGAAVAVEIPHTATQGADRIGDSLPAIVVRSENDARIVVVERPRSLPGTDAVHARADAVRRHYGDGTVHLWFLTTDPREFVRDRPLEVKPRGRDATTHMTVVPTDRQRAVVESGGGVYWLDGAVLLVPYGVHDFTHAPRDGEDWNFTDWRKDKQWHRDWRISHPLPARDADRWGLVPTTLHRLTNDTRTFDPTGVHDLMQRLADVEHARWRRRRNDARQLHTERHTAPPAPTPPHSAARSEEPLAFPEPAAIEPESDPGPPPTRPVASTSTGGEPRTAPRRPATPPRPTYPPRSPAAAVRSERRTVLGRIRALFRR